MKKNRKIFLLVMMLWLFAGTLTVYADEFTISQNKMTMNVGDTIDLDIMGTEEVPKWFSWNVNTAKVNQEGEVTALRKGKTTISAKVGHMTSKCAVTVVEPGIKMNKSTAVIYVGGTSVNTVQLKATVKGASKEVRWKSSNPKIATVDSKGKVTSISAGKVKITASANGKTTSCVVEVKKSSIALNINKMQLSTKGNGSSMKLTASVVGTKKNVAWSTSDKTVAIVKAGKVTGKGNGKATIIAKANGVTAVCEVTVIQGAVSIHTEKELLYTGENKKLKTNAGKKDTVIWNSSNEGVVSVDENGNIKAVGAGIATITAVFNDTSDKCVITVKDIITNIKEEKLSLSSDQIKTTYDLEYEISGRNSAIKWTTSDKKTATVSKGRITAKKSGKVWITATANGISDRVEVTIDLKESSVRLNQSEYTLYTKKGNTYTLKANVEGPVKKVSWESSDLQVVTVNSKGKITAVGEGRAVITAKVNDAKASCYITVKESKVIPDTENLVLDKGEQKQLPVEVIGQSQTVTYVSTNSKIVTVKKGLLTAKDYGEADIKITANGVTSVCHVKVMACEHIYDEGVEIRQATCVETGENKFTCTLCGDSKRQLIPLLKHNYSDSQITPPTCTQQGYTTHICECGKFYIDTYVEIVEHNWGEWVVTKVESEEEAGEEIRKCNDCGTEEKIEIPKQRHVHKYQEKIVPPTCTNSGYTEYVCRCGDVYPEVYDYVEQLEHDINGEPACLDKWAKETDYSKLKCSMCGNYVRWKPHNNVWAEQRSEDGSYWGCIYDCLRCKEHEEVYELEVYLTELSKGKEYINKELYRGYVGKINFNSYLDEELRKQITYEGIHFYGEEEYLSKYITVSEEGILTIAEDLPLDDHYYSFSIMIGLGENSRNACLFGGVTTDSTVRSFGFYTIMNKENELFRREEMEPFLNGIITEDMNDAEKVLAVHDWICLHTRYDYETYRGINNREESSSTKGVIRNGLAICSGYAMAFYDFINMLGIQCKVISSSSLNHAWNQVLLDGEWYWLDCTWDDYTSEENVRQDNIDYNYFLLNGKRTEDERGFFSRWDNELSCTGSYWKIGVFERYDVTGWDNFDNLEAFLDAQPEKLKHIVCKWRDIEEIKNIVNEKYPDFNIQEAGTNDFGDYVLILWKD